MAKKARSDKTALVGQMLGQYRMDQMLASGGMAHIYKATDTNLERTVAIKVLMRELLEQDDTLADRFDREAKAVAALEHDNIVRVYDYRRQDDLYYIVMNFIEGKDLADEIYLLRRQGKFMDVDRALRILGQVATALDFAHAAGIIHRDIKPSNILIDKNDKAILTDFGLVLRQTLDQTMGTAFGTPRYISPEQALASERAVPQSDIYSLAVIVYEILTGEMLFKADTPMQIALSHISEPPPHPRTINPDIPENVEREIMKALDKDPLKRHRSATEFINALKAAYAVARPLKVAPQSPDVRTPVFNEAQEYKRGIQAAMDASTGAAAKKPAQTSQESKLLDQWGDVDTRTPAPERELAAKPAAGSRRVPLTLVAVLLVVLAVGGGILMTSFLSGGGGGDSSIVREATTAPVVSATTVPVVAVADGGDLPLTLAYDGTTLVIRNTGSSAVDVSALELAKPGAAAGEGIPGTDIRQGQIPPDSCVLLVQSGRKIDPRAWECLGRDHDTLNVPGQVLFWRTATDLDPSFEVRINGEVVKVCPTIRRNSKDECEL